MRLISTCPRKPLLAARMVLVSSSAQEMAREERDVMRPGTSRLLLTDWRPAEQRNFSEQRSSPSLYCQTVSMSSTALTTLFT